MGELIGVGVAGAIIFLDTTAVAQFMICQPLIACPIWGLIVGRPEIGLFFGVGFQLLWLAALPVGAAKFPEGNLGALVATDLAAHVPAAKTGDPAWLVLTMAAVLGILVAQLGEELTPLVRRIMDRYVPRLIAAAEQGLMLRFRWLFAGAVGIHATAGLIFTIISVQLGRVILFVALGNATRLGLSASLVQTTDPLLTGLWPGLLGAGIGLIAARFVRARSWGWFAVGAVVLVVAWAVCH